MHVNVGLQQARWMLEDRRVDSARATGRVGLEHHGKERAKGKTMEKGKVGGET